MTMNLYVGYNGDDFQEYKSKVSFEINNNKITFVEMQNNIAKAKEKRKAILDFYNHYKTHYKPGSQQLCELRCVTAWAIFCIEEHIRANIFCCPFDELPCMPAQYWSEKGYKEKHTASADNLETMAKYATDNGFTGNFHNYEYFDYCTDTRMQKLRIKMVEQPKRKIGFY